MPIPLLPNQNRLSSNAAFNAAKARLNGGIVIYDAKNDTTTMHRATCSFVKDLYFDEKVVQNSEKNGSYWGFPTVRAMKRAVGNHGKACDHCKP